ncbi:MAG: hypothetical protein EBU49_15010, partial [Proteobacteria bacterium]|nr:hypothetical protein [Pseudomonadota bacterium]
MLDRSAGKVPRFDLAKLFPEPAEQTLCFCSKKVMVMKNIVILSVAAVMVVSACRTAKFTTDSGINRGANAVPT